MNKFDIQNPSREQFVQEKMMGAPRFNLLEINRLPKQHHVGMASLMGGVTLDALQRDFPIYRAFGRAVDAITGVRESVVKTSGVDLATAVYAVTLFSVGYLGYAVVDFLTKKSNFNNAVEAAAYSEYGQGK